MAFTHIFTATIEPLSFFSGGGSSDAIDTRGCDLIVFTVSANQNSGPFCSDNQGNHYFHDLSPAAGLGIKNVNVYSVGTTDVPGATPLVTSENHVFTIGGGTYGQSCIIRGFSGVNASDPIDIDGAGQTKDTTSTPLELYIDASTVLPSLDGNLVITGCTFSNVGQDVHADEPFTDGDVRDYGPSINTTYGVADHWGNASAFIISNPAISVTPRWSTAPGGPLAASVTVFNVGTPSPPVPGGSGDVDGWFDTSRWIRKPI